MIWLQATCKRELSPGRFLRLENCLRGRGKKEAAGGEKKNFGRYLHFRPGALITAAKKGTHFERDKEGGGDVELTCLHAVFKLLVMERMEEDGPAGGER